MRSLWIKPPANDAVASPYRVVADIVAQNREEDAFKVAELIVYALHKQGWTFFHASELQHLYQEEDIV